MKSGKHPFTSMALGILLTAGLNAYLATADLLARPEDPSASAGVVAEAGPVERSKETEALLDGLRARVTRRAEQAEALAQAERLARAGEALDKKGERDGARAHFEKARQTLLAVDETRFYEPGAHTLFLQLTDRLAPLTGDRGHPPVAESLLRMAANEPVQAFVQYYQGPGRDTFRTAFMRRRRYEAMMRKVFQEEGVPEDLIYIGLVESAYNPYAASPAGARGLWQFMPGTGRRYGLRQSGTLDERQNPEKSTRAAARYLRDLYALFGDWPLALAAYNAGEYRVLRVLEKSGLKDFWQIRAQGLLPAETMNYVPSVLAAIRVGQQAFETRARRRAAGDLDERHTDSVGR